MNTKLFPGLIALSIVLLLAPPLGAQNDDGYLLKRIDSCLAAGNCSSAQKLYNVYMATVGHDSQIEHRLRECNDDRQPVVCEYLQIGEYTYCGYMSKPVFNNIVRSNMANSHPELNNYFYIYDARHAESKAWEKEDYNKRNHAKEGDTIRTLRASVQCYSRYDDGRIKYDITLVTPDHKKNLRNALVRLMRQIKSDEKISISQIVLPEGKDYMDEDDYRDEITNILLEKGFKVVASTGSQQNKARYGIDVKMRNESMRVQVVDFSTGEYVGSVVIDF